MAGTRSRNCPSSSISRFTAIRSARNVFVAGCSFCLPLEVRAPATTVARCSVSRIGRARTMVLAILRGIPLFPKLIEQVGEFFFVRRVHNVRRRRLPSRDPCACRADPRARKEKPRSRGVQLHARYAQVRQHAVSGRQAFAPRTPRRSVKSSRAPKSPCPRNSFSRSRAISSACASRSSPNQPPPGPAAAQFRLRVPQAPPSHPGTVPPGLIASQSHRLFDQHRRMLRVQTKCPVRPASSRRRP